jgi:hypothetical protein
LSAAKPTIALVARNALMGFAIGQPVLQPWCIEKTSSNSTDSQFYSINKYTQFNREIRVDNLKETTNWVSVTAIPCFRRMNFLFPQTISLFCAEQGIACNTPELQRKWTSGRDGKRQNGERSQKFPVIFPVLRESEGLRMG